MCHSLRTYKSNTMVREKNFFFIVTVGKPWFRPESGHKHGSDGQHRALYVAVKLHVHYNGKGVP
jgi:hypothetical protein